MGACVLPAEWFVDKNKDHFTFEKTVEKIGRWSSSWRERQGCDSSVVLNVFVFTSTPEETWSSTLAAGKPSIEDVLGAATIVCSACVSMCAVAASVARAASAPSCSIHEQDTFPPPVVSIIFGSSHKEEKRLFSLPYFHDLHFLLLCLSHTYSLSLSPFPVPFSLSLVRACACPSCHNCNCLRLRTLIVVVQVADSGGGGGSLFSSYHHHTCSGTFNMPSLQGTEENVNAVGKCCGCP